MFDEQSQPRCILIIDDNPDDRLLARREIEQEFPAARLVEAASAKDFTEIFEQQLIDIVVTDYQLRWSDGITILQIVKAKDQNLPVVMFTNSGTQETAVEAMKAGLDDYVIKGPKHLVRLRRAISTVWENAQTRRRVAVLEGRLQFLLNQLTIGVFRATTEGELLEINDSLLRLLGLSTLEEARDLFQQQSVLAPLTAQRGQQGWEIEVVCASGKKIWLNISVTRSTESEEAIVDGLATDITSKKRSAETIQQLNRTLERRIQKRTAQLKATNQELEAFAFTVSHDLRAPIRQISGFVGLLEEELTNTHNPETLHRYLQKIQAVTKNANQMISDLLEYSRSGRVRMAWEPVPMNRLVGSIQQQIESNFQTTAGQAERAFPQRQWIIDPLPTIMGDQMLIRQVWQNLIDNAVKYTRFSDPSIIHIGSYDEGDEWVFWIQDNGIGFETADTEQLFNIFQRLPTQENFEGTGIGLANVKRIVMRHGGRVWAEGRPHQGATFYFSLPKT